MECKRQIWKYNVQVSDEAQVRTIPRGGKIVHVDLQNGVPTFWVDIPDVDGPLEQRVFVVRGTGHWVERSVEYVGTIPDAPFVWHLFEVR
jgi:hypothetical protein